MGKGCSHTVVIGFLENEIHGFYSVGLVKFWDSCKTASAVFSTCICFLQCVFKIFYTPQALELDLVSLRLKRFIKSLSTTRENDFSGDPINREIT